MCGLDSSGAVAFSFEYSNAPSGSTNLFSNSVPGRPSFNAYWSKWQLSMAFRLQMLHFYLIKGWYGADHSGGAV
jgi:hypothetical protein